MSSCPWLWTSSRRCGENCETERVKHALSRLQFSLKTIRGSGDYTCACAATEVGFVRRLREFTRDLTDGNATFVVSEARRPLSVCLPATVACACVCRQIRGTASELCGRGRGSADPPGDIGHALSQDYEAVAKGIRMNG